MPDNQGIHGIRDDNLRQVRKKPRGKRRKPFKIETRIVAPKGSFFRSLGLYNWWVWGCYETESRRDQAYANLVKKEKASRILSWGHQEYRKFN